MTVQLQNSRQVVSTICYTTPIPLNFNRSHAELIFNIFDRTPVAVFTHINYYFSLSFKQGMVAVIDPTTSWAAKWTHHKKHVPGCYALAVQSNLPQYISEILESNGIQPIQDD